MRECQRQQIKKDVAWMIRQSGQTATILRSQNVDQDQDIFYGSHRLAEVEIGTIDIEIKNLSAKDLAEIGTDKKASVLPDSGIEEQDVLEVNGVRYRVTEVKAQNLFGEITHFDLHLELEKLEVSDG